MPKGIRFGGFFLIHIIEMSSRKITSIYPHTKDYENPYFLASSPLWGNVLYLYKIYYIYLSVHIYNSYVHIHILYIFIKCKIICYILYIIHYIYLFWSKVKDLFFN